MLFETIVQDLFDSLKHCILCQDKNHKMSKCVKYPNQYPKVDKLKYVHACLLCGKVGHYSKAFSFDFKFKCHCGKNHFYFMCLNK